MLIFIFTTAINTINNAGILEVILDFGAPRVLVHSAVSEHPRQQASARTGFQSEEL